MKFISIVTIVIMFIFVGCASLTEAGKGVRVLKEAPKNCKELGDLSSGTFASKPSQTDVKNDLRNKTAEMGGNLLVLDSINSVFRGGYSGSGRAFKCRFKKRK